MGAITAGPTGRQSVGAIKGKEQVAFLVFAHSDAEQVHRLRRALAPFPVYLHCDVRTAGDEFAAMTQGLPADRIVQPRQACKWAQWGLVAAEIAALEQALRTSTAEHFVVMTGSDYPMAPVTEIARFLAPLRGRSVARIGPMPRPNWGSSGGLARLKYRHFGWNKTMIRIPVPRSLPSGIVPGGGGHQMVLSRAHAEIIVDVHGTRPDLVRFWRRTWSSDETFVPTILLSPQFGIDWAAESADVQLWWIGWDGVRRKSPPVLTSEHFSRLRDGRFPTADGSAPKLFARKFESGVSGELLDRVDDELRSLATAP